MYVKVDGETVETKPSKARAKAAANQIARDALLTIKHPATITVEDSAGNVYRKIQFDGWNSYTLRQYEK